MADVINLPATSPVEVNALAMPLSKEFGNKLLQNAALSRQPESSPGNITCT